MARIQVQPRPTPAERSGDHVEVEVDEPLTVFIETMEDWVAPRQQWELELREGTDFDKTNNIEAQLLYVDGAQTSSLLFRLEQLDSIEDAQDELVLRFEERDGIAKLARLTSNGLDVELFHILTFT
jgi:hypothetical protein